MAESTALEDLYSEIKSLTEQAADKIRDITYVEKYGELPSSNSPRQETKNGDLTLAEVKVRIRKLNDKICKLKAKLKPNAKSKNPDKIIEWQVQLEQSEMDRESLLKERSRLES